MYIPGTTYLHILLHIRVFLLIFIIHSILYCTFLSHCTSYTFYFIICSLFHSHLYLYIYSLVLCFIVLLLMLFLFSILSLLLLFFFCCTVHWADLSRPTFHYWLYPVWLCMWQIIKNLEPWTTSVHETALESTVQLLMVLWIFLPMLMWKPSN